MKSRFLFSGLAWNPVLACSLLALGCVQGGPGIASGDCAIAVGGPAILTVSPQVQLSLGDSAIEAASQALRLYLTKLPTAIGVAETKQATATAVDAAEGAKGTPLTVAERQEIENRAQVAIGEYRARCAKS